MPGPPPVRARAALALLVFAAMMCTPAALAEQYRLPLFVSETAQGQQGVLRVLSLSDESGTVEVYAVDDSGSVPARRPSPSIHARPRSSTPRTSRRATRARD